jgi:hypothetical protein
MVSGWGRFDARGANRLRESNFCVAPLLPEFDKDSTAAQTAITVPLQEQVSMTSKIALSRATLANATVLTMSRKKPRIRSRKSSLLKGNFRTDRLA